MTGSISQGQRGKRKQHLSQKGDESEGRNYIPPPKGNIWRDWLEEMAQKVGEM